ncbi:MAG: glycosyltransferase family 4 protein [Planctomycetota bacterium]
MESRPLNIGFVSVHAATDLFFYSGSNAAMRGALLDEPGVRLFDLDRLTNPMYPIFRAKQVAYWLSLRKRYWMNREPFVLRGYAKQVMRRASAIGNLDFLLSPSSIPLAYYAGPIPTAIWPDATFAGLADFYPEATGLAAETLRNGNRMEAESLRNCSIALYSSGWAAQTAILGYGIDPSKVEVVPYGANLETIPTGTEVASAISSKPRRPLRLLFVGGDWWRKGGDIAVAATESLVRRGLDARLDIIGSSPTAAVPSYATIHGFLRKDRPEDCRQMARLFAQSHLLILPTRADCVPVVIAEACAYGVPTIATNVGGISSAIQAGRTGQLMPPSSSPSDWADAVEKIVAKPTELDRMGRAARLFFESDLNWPTAVRKVVGLLRERWQLVRAV